MLRGNAQGGFQGKLLSTAKRNTAPQVSILKYPTSDRSACELGGLSRAAYRYMPLPRDDEELLRVEVTGMAGHLR